MTITPTPAIEQQPDDARRNPDANESQGREDDTDDNNDTVGVLRLRGRAMPNQHVRWEQQVVDNEGLNRKKSKICCIYHKPKAFDESSDESSDSDNDSDSSQGSADSRQGAKNPRKINGRRKHKHKHEHGDDHNGGECSGHHDGQPGEASTTRSYGSSTSTMLEHRAPSPSVPNAYERPAGGKGKGKQ
ncbi:Type 1 phosphatases regulator ypi1 [Microbotryomycetes sp. JL221]|nr:Type 1 phosphatases regulator ypi1 [Microbotryomycetes sp. JL221]